MSFHKIHELNHPIYAVTCVPRGFTKNVRDGSKVLSWDFRLVNMKVLGKKAARVLGSPKKSVKVRKASEINFDEPGPSSKRVGTA
ncbi:hypothetical protein AAF712_016332 [Marasmius tenuissimus]|uniref:Uncharacterized protein n=1 Tax=Marasmius tenuissimus TaxID=585030 RepID=A0ABR2Z5Z2_9AGAR